LGVGLERSSTEARAVQWVRLSSLSCGQSTLAEARRRQL